MHFIAFSCFCRLFYPSAGISFLYLQRQKCQSEPTPDCLPLPSLWLSFFCLSLSPSLIRTCDFIGPTQTIQDNISLLLWFSRSVVSDSLQPHELQHTRLPCPSLSPRVCSDSCLLHLTHVLCRIFFQESVKHPARVFERTEPQQCQGHYDRDKWT